MSRKYVKIMITPGTVVGTERFYGEWYRYSYCYYRNEVKELVAAAIHYNSGVS